MFQIPYDGGDTEHGVMADIFQGHDLDNITRQHNVTAADIVEICHDYCRCRFAFLADTSRRRYVWELEIAALQQLSVLFYKRAVNGDGDLKATQVYIGLINQLARLRKHYHRLAQEMEQDAPAMAADEQKAMTTHDALVERMARADELRQKGVPVPDRAYRNGDLIHREEIKRREG